MSDSSAQGYRFPGDVELIGVHFIGVNGQPTDITSFTEGINIYQNLFRHYLEADFLIHDSTKFLHKLPDFKDLDVTGGFTGIESMVVSYRNRSKGDKETVYTHLFRLYSVTDRQSLENVEAYMFSGISEEAYHTSTKTISSAYGGESGQTTESMVKAVHKNYFNNSDIQERYNSLRSLTHNRINKQLETHPTIGKHQFVIPNLSVDDTIRFFARESDCQSRVPLFYFYEDSQGFNFKNVNGLTAQEPVDTFYYSMQGTEGNEDDKIKNHQIIMGYRVNRQQDLIENMKSGLYKAETTNIDMLKKRYNKVVYNYDDYAKVFNKLQPKKVFGSVPGETPVKSLMTTRKGHDLDANFFDENPKPKRLNTIKDIRNSFRRSVFNTSVEVSIPGNPNMKVGQVVRLEFPVNDNSNNGIEEHDKYLTGNYLVTKVRQMFSTNDVTTVLECTKDGGN
jgi:hypothetical protein